MNRIKFFLLLLLAGNLLSCKKDDDTAEAAPPRDRAAQYATDIAAIEAYLRSHYLTVTADASGNPVPAITKIPEGGSQVSVWDQQQYPLQSKIVKNDTRIYTNANPYVGTLIDDPVDYKIYYLKIREGAGQSPTKIDSAFVSYRGNLLDGAEFTNIPNPQWLALDGLVSGWKAILPEFKTGSAISDPVTGSVTFTGHGVAVLFVPSGVGYFNVARPSIPSYSPLVFTINLHALQYRDIDRDGVLSKNEDLNNNGDLYDDDTDGDGIPNFLDADDDGDGVATLTEVSDSFGNKYPFASIPNCSGTTGGLRRHLDPSCH
ncbi:MAG TPA: FKBP-type peptidylprolyl isomerase [Flavobacterium sp.]|nr:FKBP-type peptidylprolyl isomerase [Flavobacterium sp.]